MRTKRYLKYILLLCTIVSVLVLYEISVNYMQKSEQEETKKLVHTTTEEKNVLEIYSEEEYLRFTQSVLENDYENWEIRLCADLDFSRCFEMRPIGYLEENEKSFPFNGTFNGNGYKISNLSINMKDKPAGMFLKLGGVVKNLWLENCFFSGEKTGVVAVEMEEGCILNCYLDAKIDGTDAGSVVSVLNGNIENCVTSMPQFYASIKKGNVDNCYIIDEYTETIMNNYLTYLNIEYNETDLNCWEKRENGNGLNIQKAVFLESVKAYLPVGGHEVEVDAYYSLNDKKWCVALPAGYMEKEIRLRISTSTGNTVSMTKPSLETEIYCIQEECVFPISFLCDDSIDTMYISLAQEKNLSYVHEHKLEEIPGVLILIKENGEVSYATLQGFYGHGNDSWLADKKSYNLKFDSYVDLLGLGANEDFALLAGYRRNSLMNYVAAAEIGKELGIEYAQDFRLVNLYVAGEYAGVYFLAEKNKIDRNRIDITNIYEKTISVNEKQLESFEYQKQYKEDLAIEQHYYNIPHNPKDITGGYLLEIDIEDYANEDSRFVSRNGVGVVLKRARFSSKEQVEYISEFWQEFEDALFSENGVNLKGKRYTEYIDLESFALQWLMYEMQQEISLNSSIYYYKESDVDGDGVIHACQPWDVESSFVLEEVGKELWLPNAKEKTLNGYWKAFYQHEDFRKELSRVWKEKMKPVLLQMTLDDPREFASGAKNLCWYRYNSIELHKLENSRWRYSYPWNRINEIEEFLRIRTDALDNILGDKK